MGMQDLEVTGSTTVVTNYGLGARGIDLIERVGTSTVTGFPIYDAHGNNVATLTRAGSSYAVSDQRSCDAWGGIRAQQSAGDPKLRYCANLGHKQDDESGLIYMRARYYEPTSGTFTSQYPARGGLNFYTFADNSPVNRVDASGTESEDEFSLRWFIQGVFEILFGMVLVGISFNLGAIITSMQFQLRGLRGLDKIPSSILSEVEKASYRFKEQQHKAEMAKKKIGVAATAIIGYSLILDGWLRDIMIEGCGLDVVQTVWGSSE